METCQSATSSDPCHLDDGIKLPGGQMRDAAMDPCAKAGIDDHTLHIMNWLLQIIIAGFALRYLEEGFSLLTLLLVARPVCDLALLSTVYRTTAATTLLKGHVRLLGTAIDTDLFHSDMIT